MKSSLQDQQVWGNPFVARQGKVMLERSCLVTIQERKVVVRDFWDRKDTRSEGEGGLLRDCDTPSSLPSLVSDQSHDEDSINLLTNSKTSIVSLCASMACLVSHGRYVLIRRVLEEVAAMMIAWTLQ